MNKGVEPKTVAENCGKLNPEQPPVFIDFLKLRVDDVEAPNPYFEMIALQLLKYKLLISHRPRLRLRLQDRYNNPSTKCCRQNRIQRTI